MKEFFKSRNKWLVIFGFTIFVSFVLIYVTSYFPPSNDSYFYPLITNYGGNISSGIIGGFLFLFLTFYIDANTEEKIGQIHDTVRKSEEALSKREKILENEKSIFHFEQFMKNDSYYNVRFPSIILGNQSIGIEYTIRPVRDSSTNEPIKKVTEMNSYYIVKIDGPANWEVMSSEDRQTYDESPVRDNEYYYCSFFNNSWHMSPDGTIKWDEFYLSSKMGPVEYGETANEFMATYEDPTLNKTKLATLHLKEDGTRLTTAGGCTSHEIYQDVDNNLYLRIWKSQLKLMYFTNPEDTYGDTGWFFKIEDIRGYASGTKLQNIIKEIQSELTKLKIEVKKNPWYETKEHAYES